MTSTRNGLSLRVARRLTGALLVLYPSAFRDEFGVAVRSLIDRDLVAAAAYGQLALLSAVVTHAWDIVLSAVSQRRARLTGRRGTMANGGDGVLAAWNAWRRDAKYGARLLAKQRTFSVVVVITLALAIGANTVIFTFANVLLVRPLPWRDQATLGWLFNIGPQAEGDKSRVSLADFEDFRASARSFSALAARRLTTVTLSGRGDAERLNTTEATANLFDVWGLQRVAGRLFRPGDDATGAAPVAVLSHQFWQRRFGGDRDIVGQTLLLDGVSHTIVGVLDPAIEVGNLATIDVYTPLTLAPGGSRRDDRQLTITGRLLPGVTPTQASAEIQTIAKRLQQEHPQTNRGWDAHVISTRQAMVGGNAWLAFTLLGLVVSFVLMIACANLANLMLSRSTERAREIAIRTALGASGRAIVRQLLIESLLLGTVGGIAGLLLAKASLVFIKSVSSEGFFKLLDIDRNVLVFVGAITLATTVAFSLMPALQLARAGVGDLLKAGTGKASGGARVRRGRAVLVVSQVALAVSLTVVGVLIVRSLIATTRIDPGFDSHNAFIFRVDVPSTRYAEPGRLLLLYEKTLAELRAIPGVSGAALTSRLPILGGDTPGPVAIDGRSVSRPADQAWAVSSAVSVDFFQTARIAMLSGRTFTRDDNASAPRAAIVNQEMAKRYWGSPAAAIGKRVSVGDTAAAAPMTIVGVVADTRPADVSLPPNPQLYVPIAQQPERSVAFFLRAVRAPALFPDVRAAVRRVDDGLALFDARTVDEALSIENSSDYVLTGMYMAFAVIALTLAAAGLYGVISYSVSQRTRELGIRVALGATASEVRSLVLVQGARLLVGGTVIGIVVGALIASTMRALLSGVSPLDPTTYFLVVGVFAVVMGVATYVPARRAVSVDPIKALRAE